MEFEQQPGGESTGDASCNEQITDPGEEWGGICGGGQVPFEGLQLSYVLAAPQGIDQRVFSRPRLGELGSGHSRVRFIPPVMAPAVCLCHRLKLGFLAQKKPRWAHQGSKHSPYYFHDSGRFRQRMSAHLIDGIGVAYRSLSGTAQ